MPREFKATELVRSTPERVFDFVADYRNVPKVLDGVTRWEPIGDQSRGEGATFKVEISALGIALGDILQLDTWKRPETIGWHSTGHAMEQEGRWRFVPREDGVELELRIKYDPPAGLVGEALAGAVESVVRRRLETALRRMRDLIDSDHA